METPQSKFGRRSQPHHITVARGEKVRTVSVPAWMLWSGAGACLFALTWLLGSTVYIAFHDDIYEAARAHRTSVERAYEDRIATLRRQIDEINTRQFLDQRVFEDRLEELLVRQTELEERHEDIAGLFEAAKTRKLTVNIEPGASRQVAGHGSIVTASAHGAAFDPSRPAPLDPARTSAQRGSDQQDGATVDRIEASLARVESLQDTMLSALETTVGALSAQLVEVSGVVGADLPDGVEADGVGGPLVELRRLDVPDEPDRQIDRIRDDLDRFDALREHVSHLPVRLPLDGPIKLTSGFGSRLDPFLKRPALHTGVDFRASPGTPVHASAGGLVTIAGNSGGYGRLVEIDHGNGYRTRYGHMSRILVEPGARIAAGDVVGLVGSTGRSTGPHLHYETRVLGYARDPIPFVEAAELLPVGF